MPYCRYCGTENTAESKFCKECGQPSGRGRHPAVGTFGMVLSVIGLLLFCAKPSLGMTILSSGVVVLIYAAISGNLKLHR